MSGVPERQAGLFSPLGVAARDVMQKIIDILRGGVSLHDNCGFDLVTFTSSATPNAENTVDITSLKISWVPSKYFVVRRDKAGHLYESSYSGWSATEVRFKCDVSSVTFTVALF